MQFHCKTQASRYDAPRTCEQCLLHQCSVQRGVFPDLEVLLVANLPEPACWYIKLIPQLCSAFTVLDFFTPLALMATLDSLQTHLYLLTETCTKFFGSAEDVCSVTLFVNGVSATFNVRPNVCFTLGAPFSACRSVCSVLYALQPCSKPYCRNPECNLGELGLLAQVGECLKVV